MTILWRPIRAIVLAASGWVFLAMPCLAETLVLQGSSTFNSYLMLPYQHDIEAAAGHTLKVIPSKSSIGLIALLEGRADLAMISASLESELAPLQASRPELPYHLLQSFLISKVRIAFPVNRSNPIRSVKLAQIRQILEGEIGNWRELGGPDLPIQVVSVNDGGGVTRTIEAALFEGRRITPRHPINVEFGSQVPNAVEQNSGALGLAQLSELRRHGLAELKTERSVDQSLYLISLKEPSDAMGEVIYAARKVIFGED
jgi:phosphate transport system substrate-binding protein